MRTTNGPKRKRFKTVGQFLRHLEGWDVGVECWADYADMAEVLIRHFGEFSVEDEGQPAVDAHDRPIIYAPKGEYDDVLWDMERACREINIRLGGRDAVRAMPKRCSSCCRVRVPHIVDNVSFD